MEHVSIRFLIGLGERRSSAEILLCAEYRQRAMDRTMEARRILRDAYSVGDFKHGIGVWRGAEEDSLVFETIQRDSPAGRTEAKAIAQALAVALNQDAIGLVFAPVQFHLVEQNSTRYTRGLNRTD